MKKTLRPNQKQALDKLSNGKILWGGVGSGKSFVAAEYYMKNEAPKDVYVITTAKKRDHLDWDKEFASHGVGKAPEASVAGVLTVDSWNNIKKYVEVKNAFFILDEQRLVGKGSWTKSFLKIAKNNHWILLSATPGDTWFDYIPVFIANGYYKNRTDFIRQHVVYNHYSKFPKVDHYVQTGTLLKHRNDVLVHMPYEKHTRRLDQIIEVEYDEALMRKVTHDRWNPYADRPIRDAAEMYSVMRRVANSDPSRLLALWQLLEKHPRLIVFYSFNYELEILRTLGEEYEVKEWNGHKHEMVPSGDAWVYLVQYTAGAEGWECITTDSVCFYSLNYSYKIWEQAHGRTDRLNTPFVLLNYFILRSRAWIDSEIWKSKDKKEDFQESSYDPFS